MNLSFLYLLLDCFLSVSLFCSISRCGILLHFITLCDNIITYEPFTFLRDRMDGDEEGGGGNWEE